ncbi:MAG: serine/threonine protein kinase [Planctomycetes bacterium]|nr:serine/threonine protein kinase [Planctomycetota bacterium]
MPSNAAQEFLELAERSGLVAPATARETLAQLTLDGAATTDKVAEHLVEKKVLTIYQVEQLIAGKGEDCVIAGRYHVLAKLGEGGMGAVYQAHDTKLDRVVAVKVLPAGRLHDADAVARFQREAKALARLSHPHIIQAFDSGDERGRHFLVMEFVEGVTLDKVLRQHGALAPTLAADLIHQTALGLHHAHEKGLIHRDLKPANLLVAGLAIEKAQGPPSLGVVAPTVDYAATPSPRLMNATATTVKFSTWGWRGFCKINSAMPSSRRKARAWARRITWRRSSFATPSMPIRVRTSMAWVARCIT